VSSSCTSAPPIRKGVMFDDSIATVISCDCTLTQDECTSYWWTRDEIQFFHERAYQAVQALLSGASVSVLACTNKTSFFPSNLMWIRRSSTLRRAYDLASQIADESLKSDMNSSWLSVHATAEVCVKSRSLFSSLVTDWVGLESRQSGSMVGSTPPTDDFGALDVSGIVGTPRGLEKHYMYRQNEHMAAAYRGKLIAYYRTRTRSDTQLAAFSMTETLTTRILARMMGHADYAAISSPDLPNQFHSSNPICNSAARSA
jgi:hypothetical protein